MSKQGVVKSVVFCDCETLTLIFNPFSTHCSILTRTQQATGGIRVAQLHPFDRFHNRWSKRLSLQGSAQVFESFRSSECRKRAGKPRMSDQLTRFAIKQIQFMVKCSNCNQFAATAVLDRTSEICPCITKRETDRPPRDQTVFKKATDCGRGGGV